MLNETRPFKTGNVSYSHNEICKTLSVPLINQPFKFGTGMTDPVWRRAARADDFVPFGHKSLGRKSRMALFRTADKLVVGFFFYEKPENLVKPDSLTSSPWSGDMAEIHFGGMDPDPWLLQLGVGITGIRFDSSGYFDKWQAKIFENSEGWGAEIMITTSILRLTEGGMRFNLCRQALKRNEYSCWSPLRKRFHEVENFGELLFTDYKTCLQMRSGLMITGRVFRKQFEALQKHYRFPAHKIICGPYLSNPDKDSLCISWETAGLVPTFLEYKVKGSKDAPVRLFSGKANGIVRHDTTHFIHIQGIKPGVEYEYELFYLTPVMNSTASFGVKRSFCIPEENEKNFSFLCFSDIHSDVGFINRAMATPEAEKASFITLLGDNLSHAAGREALYRGIIDPIISTNKTKQDKPLVFVRGNHEQLGVYAADYFKVMRHPSGNTHYAFSYGDVCFVVLDCGDDHNEEADHPLFSNTAMRQKEKKFIEEVVKSDAFQKASYRVIMLHIPPLNSDNAVQAAVHDMLQPLRKAKCPPDLLLAGHIHSYMRVDANSDSYHPVTRSRYAERFPKTMLSPFPVVVSDNDTVMECRVTPSSMELNVIRPGNDGKSEVVDRVSILKREV